jgi:hypothetical protein
MMVAVMLVPSGALHVETPFVAVSIALAVRLWWFAPHEWKEAVGGAAAGIVTGIIGALLLMTNDASEVTAHAPAWFAWGLNCLGHLLGLF